MKTARILFSALTLSILASGCIQGGVGPLPPITPRGISPDSSTKRPPTLVTPVLALNLDEGSWSNIWALADHGPTVR